jgi:hypothetical protein
LTLSPGARSQELVAETRGIAKKVVVMVRAIATRYAIDEDDQLMLCVQKGAGIKRE